MTSAKSTPQLPNMDTPPELEFKTSSVNPEKIGKEIGLGLNNIF